MSRSAKEDEAAAQQKFNADVTTFITKHCTREIAAVIRRTQDFGNTNGTDPLVAATGLVTSLVEQTVWLAVRVDGIPFAHWRKVIGASFENACNQAEARMEKQRAAPAISSKETL